MVDYCFKVVIVGDFGVGKSSILSRLTQETIQNQYNKTIRAEVFIKVFQVCNNQIKLEIQDTRYSW